MNYKLPKRIPRIYKFPKSLGYVAPPYSYQQSEPLYVPFYNRLSRLFDRQRIDLENSGTVNKLLNKKIIEADYIKNYLDNNSNIFLKDTYKALKNYYLKQYNLTREILQEEIVPDLNRKQKLYIKKISQGINDHTKDRVTSLIQRLIREQTPSNKAKIEIESLFNDMGQYRSERISRTELTKADNESKFDIAKENNNTKKKWILSEICKTKHCRVCRENSNIGWIKINERFSSGNLYPPPHPNCSCGIIFKG